MENTFLKWISWKIKSAGKNSRGQNIFNNINITSYNIIRPSDLIK